MQKHNLNLITHNKRQKIFGQEYPRKIEIMQKRGSINSLKIISQVRKGISRIEKTFNKFSKSEIRLRQAIFVSRKGASLTDAIIDASIGIRNFESKPLKERNEIWEKNYSEVIDNLLRLNEVKKFPRIGKYIDGLNSYFTLPKGIYIARSRHWALIKRIEEKIQRKKTAPIENFNLEIEKIIKKTKSGENAKIKAMDVCVAASIYADIMEKRERGNWQVYYRAAMETAYYKLKQKPEILEAIIELK